MIPVVNDLGKFKFTKRGKSRDFELKKLFMFSLKNIQGNVEMWSKEMQ